MNTHVEILVSGTLYVFVVRVFLLGLFYGLQRLLVISELSNSKRPLF